MVYKKMVYNKCIIKINCIIKAACIIEAACIVIYADSITHNSLRNPTPSRGLIF